MKKNKRWVDSDTTLHCVSQLRTFYCSVRILSSCFLFFLKLNVFDSVSLCEIMVYCKLINDFSSRSWYKLLFFIFYAV